jgi:hypothetical protein
MKREPDAYVDDLERDGQTSWEAWWNYQARNFMRDQMQEGDGALFTRQCRALRRRLRESPAPYPDHLSEKGPQMFRRGQLQRSRCGSWWTSPLSRTSAARCLLGHSSHKGLEMKVIQKGSRLSVQPVAKSEYDIVVKPVDALAKPDGTAPLPVLVA